MATSKRKQQHAVAIPLPGQGHINPLMRFCKRLASQEGFTITFVDIVPFSKEENTEDVSKQEHESIDANTSPASLAADVEAHEKLDIRRAHIPMEIPKPGEGSTILENFFGALQSLAPRIEELLSKLIHDDVPITCLISDIYMTGPTQKVADKFNVPRIAFNTGSQSVLLFTNYILEGTVSLEEVLKVVVRKEGSKENIFVERLLGLPTLRNGEIMDYLDDNLFLYEFKFQTLKETKEGAHAFVVNSFEELEGPALNVNNGLPTCPVGPLLEPLAISLGVPMLCLPYMADQFMNAKFIIEEWKVGLGFKSCNQSGLVMRDEVERVIQTLMVEDEGKVLQRNANYFKEVSYRNLLLEGGASKNIQALVHSLR